MDVIPTIPDILCLKQCHPPDKGYKVWSLEDIPKGVRFGPYEETFINIDKEDTREAYQGQVQRTDKEILVLYERNENGSSWLPYVNYTDQEEEANLISFHTKSGMYYISCTLIPANTELLIYGQEYDAEEIIGTMSSTRCAVAICNNNLKNTSQEGLNISYHSFPKDKKIRNIWIKACQRKDRWNWDTSVICSSHFKEEDFETNLMAQLVKNVKTKRILKPGVVPSLLLRKEETAVESQSARVIQNHKKAKREIVADILETAQETEMLSSSSASIITQEVTEERYQQLRKQHDILHNKYNLLRQSIYEQKKKLEEMDLKVADISTKLEKIATDKEQLDNILSSIFSPAQKDLLLKGKKQVIWKTDDMSRAFTLRYLSRRCYIYLRKVLKYPLPHISTLRQWAAKLDFCQGILKDIMCLMKIAAINKGEPEKVTVLQFDEMKVEPVYEYDKQKDEIVGPHKYLQIIMARGLFASWKQPVYIDFDKIMTKGILNDVISQLHNIGYNVVACVADCREGNMSLWKELNLNVKKPFFEHPMSEERIYFFIDALHLLNIIHNQLIGTGFIVRDGEIVNKKPIEELLKIVDTEVQVCHKLNKKHLNCEATKLQGIELAAQLFSHEVATALLHYKPGDKKLAEETGKFIELVATWFDIMNSCTPSHSLHTCRRKPYGLMTEQQNESLNEIYSVFRDMRCVDKITLQTFQKGVLISINSLKLLYEAMKSKYNNCTYILTHRLNHDSLKSLFSQIRQVGGLHNHPSPLVAIQRIRLIVLGKNPVVVQDNFNIKVETEGHPEEYLVASVIRQTNLGIQINDLELDISRTNIEMPLIVSDSESTGMSSSTSRTSVSLVRESDAFKYLCEWVAKKFETKYDYLTTNNVVGGCPYSIPDWLQHLSIGGLTSPSDQWLKEAKVCERYFKKFHKDNFKRGPGITRDLISIIKNKIDTPEDVINAFIIQRIYIRIKCLNELRKETRKRKLENSSRKLKKIKEENCRLSQ